LYWRELGINEKSLHPIDRKIGDRKIGDRKIGNRKIE
jgi:hypothetical protein